MKRTDRSQWHTKLIRLEDSSSADDYWLAMSPQERVEFAWTLSMETWQLAHPDQPDEPRLSRHITSIVRRKR